MEGHEKDGENETDGEERWREKRKMENVRQKEKIGGGRRDRWRRKVEGDEKEEEERWKDMRKMERVRKKEKKGGGT